MPITPYTTPVQFEYKPLNLAAFAVPLGKMQEQFDLVDATIKNTDFDISHLPYGSDPERAKELIETARAKRDELAKNLLETKNYRQAAVKLTELNRTWNKDPEKVGLESNYKLWLERDKAERERIDNGKADQITRDQYLQWRADEIRKYETAEEEGGLGGAAFKADYTNPEGTYKKVTGTTGRLADLEDELQKLTMDVASKVNSDKFESALRAVGIDEETQHKLFKKSSVEQLTKEKVAKAVHDYLLKQPKYKAWGEEVAKYNFLDILHSGKFNEYAQNIVGKDLSSTNSQLKQREEYLKKVQGKKEEDPVYNDLLKRQQLLGEMQETGQYDPNIVKNLYTEEHLANMYDMRALGKVFEFKKIDTEDVARSIPQDKTGSGLGALGAGDVIVTPNKFENFSVNNLNKTIYSNVDKMMPYLQKVGNIGGGAARTIFLGQKGTETRDKNSKNPGAYRDRIERGLSIFTDLKRNGATSHVEFYKALNRAGITATQSDAKKLWEDLSAPNSGSLTLMQSALDNTAQAAYDYNSAKEIQNNIIEGIKNNSKVQQDLIAAGKESTSFTISELYKRYTKEELKAVGVTFPEDKLPAGSPDRPTTKLLTFDQLAKLEGYKNTKEAFEKGFNFLGRGVIDGQNTQEYMQNMLNQSLVKLEMSKRLVGNKEVDAYMNNQFLVAGDLATFKSAFGGIDPEVFDEKGNILPGVTLSLGTNKNVKMNFHGNDVYYEVPVKIKTEDGEIEKTIPVKPKIGSQAFNQRALTYATKVTEGQVDELQKQANDITHAYSFNNRFKNSLSPQTFESTEISKSGSIPLMTIPNIVPGADLVVKKEYPYWKSGSKTYYGEDPVMHVYINGEIQNDPNTGKPFYTTNTNAVKAFIDRGLPLK